MSLRKIFYGAMDIIEEKSGESGHEAWKKALANIQPSVEVRSRRVGGATFQIPTEVRPDRRRSVGMKWLIRYARLRNGKSMAEKLAAEIMAAANGEGAAVKKKRTRTAWRKRTKHSLTLSSNYNSQRIDKKPWLRILIIKGILESLPTLMRVRRRPQSVFSSTRVSLTKSGRCTTVEILLPQWTGWSRSRSVVLPLPLCDKL